MIAWLKSWFYCHPRFEQDLIRVERLGWHTWDGSRWLVDETPTEDAA